MPIIVMDSNSKLSVDDFLRSLEEAEKNYDPVDELIELKEELERLEHKYRISSAEFYGRYLAGEMGDSVEVIGWAGTHRLYMQLKAAISDSLKRVVADQTARKIRPSYASKSIFEQPA